MITVSVAVCFRIPCSRWILQTPRKLMKRGVGNWLTALVIPAVMISTCRNGDKCGTQASSP